MRRNPIYVFKDQTTLGIYDIPLESMIQIIDSDGVGTPLFIQLTDKSGLSASSTIADFLAIPGAYINLDKDTLSELEKVGDGWRLLGKNPTMYSVPGVNAIDLSTSEVVGNYGARGVASFAVGTGTKAQNPNSVAMGTYNVGTNSDTLLEIGSGTYAAPKNIVEVFANGTVATPDATTAEIDNAGAKALTTVEYVQGRIAAEFPSKTTDDLTEGNNFYYTEARDTANFNTNIALQNISVLTDVDTTTTGPVTGQVLKWSGVSWIPGDDNDSVTTVNAKAGDVILNTDDVAEGANLYYTEGRFGTSLLANSTTNLPEGSNEYYTTSKVQTVAGALISTTDLKELNDVSTTPATPGQVLVSDGALWSPSTVVFPVTEVNTKTGIVSLGLNDIAGVDIVSATTGQVLSFDGTNWMAVDDTDTTYGLANTTVDGLMSKVDFNKLAGVEAGATADQSGAEIKTAYEAESDTNVYDDAAVTKLAGVEALAQVNAVAIDVGDSTAADVPALVADFNALLASLRTAGIIA